MEKPRYRLRGQAWIGGKIEPAGAELTYEGRPGYNLEPINSAALAMYEKHNPQPEGVPQMKIEPAGGDTGWEGKALAAGWLPPGSPVDWATPAMAAGWLPGSVMKAAESTPAPAPMTERAAKPAAAAGVAGSAAAGGNQKPAASADI